MDNATESSSKKFYEMCERVLGEILSGDLSPYSIFKNPFGLDCNSIQFKPLILNQDYPKPGACDGHYTRVSLILRNAVIIVLLKDPFAAKRYLVGG